MTLNQFVPSSGGGALVQWTVSAGSAHVLAVGGDWRMVDGESREDLLDRETGTQTMLRRQSGGRQDLGGVFLQEVFTPASRVTLTAAVRHDRWRNAHGHNLEANLDGTPAVGNRPTLADRSDFATSPRLAAVVRLSNAASVWGSAGWAFRAPTLNELYRQFRVGAVTTLANESLGAERLRSVESGVRLALSSSTRLRATAFDNVLDDAVSNVTISSSESAVLQQRQNLGRSRVRGVQADVDFRTAPSFGLRAGYLYTDARVDAFAAFPALVGKRLPQVPRHRATAELSYWGPRVLQFTLTVQSAGRQFDDDLNARTLPGDSKPGLPRYALVGLRVSKPIGRAFDLSVSAQNLFDTTYIVGTLPTTIGAPRLVTAGIRWRVGR